MPDDWRITECANQLLLFAACDARASMLGRREQSCAALTPLHPFGDVPSIPQVRVIRERIAANHLDVEPLAQFLKWIRGLPENTKWLDRLREQPPWKVGDVLTWWIQAGAVLAAWKWDRSMSGAEFDPDPRRSIDGRPPMEWLYCSMLRNLFLEADEEHPAFWFVDHGEAWHMTADAAAPWPERWHEPATSRESCLIALLEWCGDPGQQTVVADGTAVAPDAVERWARDYEDRYRDFARATLRLLRRRCRFGDVGGIAARREDWRVFKAPGSPRRPRVLRPPIESAEHPGGPVLVPGWVMTPWPAVLVNRLRREWASKPETPTAIARGLARAESWTPADRGFRPILTPRDEAESRPGEPAPVNVSTEAERLVALGSLAAILAASPASGAGEHKAADPAFMAIEDRIRWVWGVEGIDLRRTRESADAARVIPFDGPVGSATTADAAVLSLACDDLPGDLVVGRIGGNCGCPAELFTAVEELDWRLWAVAALHRMGRLDVDALHRVLDEVDWEQYKLRLLEARLPAGRRALGDAHAALHRVSLRLSRDCPGHREEGIVAWIADAIAGVTGVICSLLAATDPAGVARVVPPRDASGAIKLSAWMAMPWEDRSPEHAWGIQWEASSQPFGQPLREALDSEGCAHVVFSAGEQASEDDLRLLAAPGLVTGSAGADIDGVAWPLRGRLMEAVTAASSPDLASAIQELRDGCSGTNAEGYHRLIQAAIADVPAAAAWVRLMQADARFAFSCHPAVEVTTAGVRVLPGSVGDPMEWQDHDTLADGEDVSIRFATDDTRSRRVVSRGRPAADSAEAHAAHLIASVVHGPAALREKADQLRLATDRRRMFGTAAESAADEAIAVGDALAAWAADGGDAVLEAFRSLAAWCVAGGFTITPDDWQPAAGAPAEGLGVERVDFHPKVPEGRIVVTRFGIKTAAGDEVAALQAFISAGPVPAGYDELRDLVVGLPDGGEAVARFRTSVLEFPRRVQSGQVDSSVAGLFDVAWKAVMKAPEREDVRQAAVSVHRLLDRSYGLITFEPKAIGEYPETWLQTAEGGRPRGQRVERLLRPGLRTIDSKLKWPAIVETR